jgi:L-amino acid N-acyltransferase YncA
LRNSANFACKGFEEIRSVRFPEILVTTRKPGASSWCILSGRIAQARRRNAVGITSDASGNGSTAIIRLATEGDAEQIAAIYAPNVTDTVISFELEPPSADEMRRRIEGTLQRYPWLVCERHDGRLLGYAYAGAHGSRAAYQWSVDVSVYVHKEARRRGVGRALYASLFAVLDLQGFYNAYAGATLPNPASVGLHESVGFRPVGVYRGVGYKMGGWHDVLWWHLPIRQRVADPDQPTDLPSVVGSEEWGAALTNGLPFLRSGS